MATIVAPEVRSPIADAEAIRKAVKGWGTDEKAIIEIIGHRNAKQRMLIRKAYEDSYQEDLIERFESELTGHFEKAVYRWMLDPAERDAVLANVALRQLNPDYGVIVELSCIYSPEEFLSVKRAYQARYRCSIEEDVASHVSGHLGKYFEYAAAEVYTTAEMHPDGKFTGFCCISAIEYFEVFSSGLSLTNQSPAVNSEIVALLVGLVSIYRYYGDEIDTRLAKSEAGILHDAIKHKVFNHEAIIRIMTTRSKRQLITTFNCYKDDYNASITKHLKGDTNDEYLTALKVTIKSIDDPQKYYEKVLRNAINKSGKDEDTVTRVIVTRAENDLKKIMELYHKRNSVSLNHSIRKKLSGDYKTFLLTLLGKEE